MELQQGITGFFDGEAALQTNDLKKFRALCYEVSMQKNVTLLKIKEAAYPRNYICAKFALNDQPFQIVMNAYYPVFSTAVIEEEGHIVFCDLPLELESFAKEYQFLSTSELQQSVDAEALANLSEMERQQIEIWSPNNIGEVVFNAWD